MKSKLTNFISLAVVMFVLTAVFTVSALADITGGFGVIEGLDDAKTYEAASVTINAAGDGYAEGTAFELNDTTNQDLAGLYIVWEKDNKDATKTDIFFVNGGIAGRQELSSTYEYQTGKFTVPHVSGKKDEWIVGTFTNPVYMHGNPSIDGTVYSINSEFIPVTPQKELIDLLNAATPDQVAITAKKTEIADYLKTISVRYAYNPEEIISAKELKTLTFTIRVSQLRIGYTGATPAVTFKVLNKDGIVEDYTWTPLNTYNSAYSDTPTFAVDAATTLEEADGWVIGFEIFPVNKLDPANVYHQTSAGSVYSNNTLIKIDTGATKYVIDKAAQPAPTGLTVEGTTVKGLDANSKYVAVPFTVNGGDTSKQIEISGVESYTFADDKVGLWGICSEGTDEYQLSAPSELVYIEGKWADRENLFDVNPNYKESDNASYGHIYTRDDTNSQFTLGSITLPGSVIASGKSKYSVAFGYSTLTSKFNEAGITQQQQRDLFEKNIPQYQAYRYAYGFNSDEIIPISEVVSYSWALAERYMPFGYKDLVSRFVAHVMAPDGTITEYEYLHTGKSLTGGFSADNIGAAKLSNNDTYNKKVDFTAQTTESGKWTTALPTEGYLVGFEIFPLYGMTDFTKVSGTGTTGHLTQVNIYVYNNTEDYEIIVPKKPAPTGLTVDDTTVNGLDSATTYVAVPYDIFGAHTENQIEIPVGSTSYTFDPATQAGLWGISIKGDEYNSNSDPSELIYISLSSDARQEIGTFDSGSETPLAKARGDGDKWVKGQFILSTTLNKVNKETDGSYSLHQLYYGINKNNADVLALIEELNKETPDEAVVAEYKANIYEKLADDYVTYMYNGEEIIPTGDLKQITIGLSKPQGFIGTFKPSVVFSVMDKSGEITEYIWNAAEAQGGGTSTSAYKFVIDLTSILPQTEGNWVVGFEIRPWGAMTADEVQVPYKELEGNPYLNNDGQIKTHFYYGIDQYVIKADAPTPALSSFPLIAGGCGQISGLNPNYLYEYRYSDDDGATFSSWSDIPAGSTAVEVTAAGKYQVRAKNTATYGNSQIAEVVVAEYASLDADVLPYTQEITKIHLPNDFVELKAEYEMDLTAKKWVSTLALENIKALSPESTITIVGENHKIVITAANIVTDEKVHYYNMDVALFGSSRFNAAEVEMYKELAGENYITDVYFETTNGLPFEEGQLMIKLGDKYDGLDVELNSYNDKINRLRLVEASTVYDGWVTFTNCDSTYVIVLAD